MRDHWTLDPGVDFLNHGSYGACPRVVIEASLGFQRELEREPVRFFERLVESELDRARAAVAPFVGARPEDLAFVANTTAGVNAVLRSLPFQAGDALLTTDHAYNACKNAIDFVAARTGAETIVAEVPLPVRDPGDVVERIVSRATPRVKLAIVDHVTSQTGLVLPIDAIVRALRERGVETLVDGAHAPGMLPLDVERIGAGYYAGNFHKWLCAPKGAAMLWVRRDLQRGIHPTAISHGLTSERPRSRFLEEFDWTGSADPSAWLSVPAAIRFVGSLAPGGWPEVQTRNRALALEARRILQDALGVQPLAPASMIGSLAAVRLPDGESEPLHARLYERHRIQVPVFSWPRPPERLLRVSAHLYNSVDQYERLASALATEL